jgi:hypothetical protein
MLPGMTPHIHSPFNVAEKAERMARDCKNEKLAMTLQYVAIGSMVLMGLAGAAHLIKDVMGGWHKEPGSRESNRLHDRMREDHDRGR